MDLSDAQFSNGNGEVEEKRNSNRLLNPINNHLIFTKRVYKQHPSCSLFVLCILGSLGCYYSLVPHPVNISLERLKPFKSQGRGMGKGVATPL